MRTVRSSCLLLCQELELVGEHMVGSQCAQSFGGVPALHRGSRVGIEVMTSQYEKETLLQPWRKGPHHHSEGICAAVGASSKQDACKFSPQCAVLRRSAQPSATRFLSAMACRDH